MRSIYRAGKKQGALSRLTAVVLVILVFSIAVPAACGNGTKYSTATPPATTTMPGTGTTSITATAKTTTPGPTTGVPIARTINTGTVDRFTVPFQPNSGTSLPYLTFYNSLKYTNDWFWLRQESPDIVRMGFTDYAQLAMGNFWSVDFLKPGIVLKLGDTFGFLQGEDTMDINVQAPVSGTLLEVNQAVLSDYHLINNSPYDTGWLVTIRMSNPDDLKTLLTAAQYALNCCPPCHCNN